MRHPIYTTPISYALSTSLWIIVGVGVIPELRYGLRTLGSHPDLRSFGNLSQLQAAQSKLNINTSNTAIHVMSSIKLENHHQQQKQHIHTGNRTVFPDKIHDAQLLRISQKDREFVLSANRSSAITKLKFLPIDGFGTLAMGQLPRTGQSAQIQIL